MLTALLTISRAYWGLCTLRNGPQDLPHSPSLFAVTAATNLVISVLINQLSLEFGQAVLIAGIEFAVLLSLTALLLVLFRFPGRLVQTLTALMGSGALIGFVVLVAFTILPEIPVMMRLGIFVWNLVVMAHILRHALVIHIAAGFVIALGYAMVLMQIVWALGGAPGTSG